MTENIRRKFNIEFKINNYLRDIGSYAESTYHYLIDNPTITNKDEIIRNLKCIPEFIEIIDKLIEELEVIYRNEQL